MDFLNWLGSLFGGGQPQQAAPQESTPAPVQQETAPDSAPTHQWGQDATPQKMPYFGEAVAPQKMPYFPNARNQAADTMLVNARAKALADRYNSPDYQMQNMQDSEWKPYFSEPVSRGAGSVLGGYGGPDSDMFSALVNAWKQKVEGSPYDNPLAHERAVTAAKKSALAARNKPAPRGQ